MTRTSSRSSEVRHIPVLSPPLPSSFLDACCKSHTSCLLIFFLFCSCCLFVHASRHCAAYEVLSHPPSRRAFDSHDEFDDSYPSVGFGRLKDDAEFYAAFNECFDRNARWAACPYQEVPSFGDDSSTDEQVSSFYDFWFGFPSWRVCSSLSSFDLFLSILSLGLTPIECAAKQLCGAVFSRGDGA